MPVEYEGLQGRTGEKASDLFQRSQNVYAGETPNHRANDLALACPKCRAKGNPAVRMLARAGAGYYCESGGHRWNDYEELMGENPDKLAFKGFKARQEGYEKITLDMPGSTLQALQAKYGDKLAETLSNYISVLTNDRFLIVYEEDLRRIEQNVGAEIKNAKQLAGATFERAEKLRELQEQVDKGPAAETAAPAFNVPGVVMINVLDVEEKLKEKAATGDPPRSVAQFLTDTVREWIKNDWI